MTDDSFGDPEGETPGTVARLRGARPPVLAVGLLTAALLAGTGPIGLAIATVTAIAWALAPVPYALAAGHVALATLAQPGLDPLAIGIVEAGFAAVLAAALLREPGARDALSAAGVTVVVVGAAAWAALGALPLWVVAGFVLLSLGAIGYGIHRYELVAFGLLAESRLAGASGTPDESSERTGSRDGTGTTTTSTTSDS